MSAGVHQAGVLIALRLRQPLHQREKRRGVGHGHGLGTGDDVRFNFAEIGVGDIDDPSHAFIIPLVGQRDFKAAAKLCLSPYPAA